MKRPSDQPRQRSGRRPGNQDTRASILAAAREAFATQGYKSASIRHIAAKAGVDPALVHHYFGNKEQLFLKVVQVPIDPGALIPQIFAAGTDGVAERLVLAFLSVWEGPVTGPAIRSLFRSAVTEPVTAKLLREFFASQIVRQVLQQLSNRIDPAEIPMRASLVASQLFGLALARYILQLEPLAHASMQSIARVVAPNLERYLLGHLPDQ